MEVLQPGCSDQGDRNAQPHCRPTMNDSIDDIDIEALLNRPRPLGRSRRRPLYKAPEFVKRLNAFEECEAGKDVIFECQWKAFPKPEIRWFHDDEDITHNPRYQTKEADNGVLTLSLVKVNKKDEGAYRCRVENQEGSSSTTGYLTVTGDFSEKPLSARPRRNAERAVSLPPHLRTITEQKSVEEEEAEIQSRMPPSPIQDFIDKATGKAGPNYLTWPLVSRAPPPEEDLPGSPESERKVDTGADSSDWKFTVPSREELRRRREERAEQELMQRLDSVEDGEQTGKEASTEAPLVNGEVNILSSECEPESPIVVEASKTAPFAEMIPSSQHTEDLSYEGYTAAPTLPVVPPSPSNQEGDLALPSLPASQSQGLVEMADKLAQSVLAEAVSDKRCVHITEPPPGSEEEIIISETVAVAASAPPGVIQQVRDLRQVAPAELQTATVSAVVAGSVRYAVAPSTHVDLEVRQQTQLDNAVTSLDQDQVLDVVMNTETQIRDEITQVPVASVSSPFREVPVIEVQPPVDLTPFPWLFYFAFSSCCAFMGVATDMFPVWYILLIFFLSLLSFRFVISSPSST